jgi:hypothetical protein
MEVCNVTFERLKNEHASRSTFIQYSGSPCRPCWNFLKLTPQGEMNFPCGMLTCIAHDEGQIKVR